MGVQMAGERLVHVAAVYAAGRAKASAGCANADISTACACLELRPSSRRQEGKHKGSSSFLKKRTKKLLLFLVRGDCRLA
jgi:hypothetical protein